VISACTLTGKSITPMRNNGRGSLAVFAVCVPDFLYLKRDDAACVHEAAKKLARQINRIASAVIRDKRERRAVPAS